MKSMLNKSFNPAKCKTTLKLAESRIKLLKNKKAMQLTQLKREVAQLLSSGQNQAAMIRVEHVVREEKTLAVYDLLEVYCELIVARLPIIQSQKICPVDLKEAVTSIIFAAPRCTDIPELKEVHKHFTAKYGKEFASAAIELRPECGVNRIFVKKLSVKAPDGPTKVKILTAIAEENNIMWEANWFDGKEQEHPFTNASNIEKDSEVQTDPTNSEAAPNIDPRHWASSNIHANAPHCDPRQRVSSLGFHGTVPSFDPTHGISPNVHDCSRSEWNSSKGGPSSVNYSERPSTMNYYSHASSAGIDSAPIRSNQSAAKASVTPFESPPKYNMGFKDAADAAHAAARSAEEARRAARAAAELASHSKNMNCAYADSTSDFHYSQTEDIDGYNHAAFRDEHVEKKSTNYLPSERNPRMEEHLGKDASRRDKTTKSRSDRNFNMVNNNLAQSTGHNYFQQASPRFQAEQEDYLRAHKVDLENCYYQEEIDGDKESTNYNLFQQENPRFQAEQEDNLTARKVGVENDYYQEELDSDTGSARHNLFQQASPRFQTYQDNLRARKVVLENDYYRKEFDSDMFPRSDSKENRPDSNLSYFTEASSDLKHRGEHASADSPFYGETIISRSRSEYGKTGEDYDIALNSNVPLFDDDPYEGPFVVFDEKHILKEDWEVKESSSHIIASQNQKDKFFSSSGEKRYEFEPSKDAVIGTEQASMYMEKEHMQIDTGADAVYDDYVFDDDVNMVNVAKKETKSFALRDLSPGENSPCLSSPDHERSTEIQETQSSTSSKRLYQPELTESFKNSPLFFELEKPIRLNFDDYDDDKDALESKGAEKRGAIGAFVDTPTPDSRASHEFAESKSLDHHSLSGIEYDEHKQRCVQSFELSLRKESADLTDYQSHTEGRPELDMEYWPRGRSDVGYSQPPSTKHPSIHSSSSASPRQTLDVSPKARQRQASSFIEHVELSKHGESSNQKNLNLDLHSAGNYLDKNDEKYFESGDRKLSLRHQETYFESERLESKDEGPKETLQTKGSHVGPVVSRRTRATQRSSTSFQPDSISSHEALPDTKRSVPEGKSSSSSSCSALEKAELHRRAGKQEDYYSTPQPNDLGGEETSKLSIDEEQELVTHFEDGRSVGRSSRIRKTSLKVPRKEAEAYYKPTHKPKMRLPEVNLRPLVSEIHQSDSRGESTVLGSISTKNAPTRDNSMKKAGHVHPKLPDFETLADRIRALNMDSGKK